MSNKQSNYPSAELSRLTGREFTGQTVESLMALARQGTPQDEKQLEKRCEQFFALCAESSIRPGVEALSLALNVSRQTFWAWCNGGGGKSREWRDICRNAKQVIIAFLEQATLNGHLNPASGIFMLKNVADYRDNVSFDLIPQRQDGSRVLSGAELPRILPRAEQDTGSEEQYEQGDFV